MAGEILKQIESAGREDTETTTRSLYQELSLGPNNQLKLTLKLYFEPKCFFCHPTENFSLRMITNIISKV